MRNKFESIKHTQCAFLVSALASLLCFLIFQVLLPCGVLFRIYPDISVIGNLPAYVLTLILFVAVFCIFFCIFQHIPLIKLQKKLVQPMTEKAYTTFFTAGSGTLLLLLAIRRMVTETTEYGTNFQTITFHQFPDLLAISLFLTMSVTAVLLGRKLCKDWDISHRTFCLCCTGLLLLNFATVLVMNVFHADIHHGIAYVESIYNVYYGVPYTNITSGIYGYLGLFLAPILHLFNGSALALLIAIALLESLVSILCLYCICSVVKENYFRLIALAMCCFSTLCMRVSNYWQVQPHRVLWPLILTAYVLYQVKKTQWRWTAKLLGYCLCTLAVLWNVESGLFCSIAFAAACVINDWQQMAWYSPKALCHCLLHIGCAISTVPAAIVIVNGYNYLCGSRELFLQDFFFPMFETDYMSDFLEVDMPIGNHGWLYVLLLFGALLLYGLSKTSFVCGKEGIKVTESTKLAPAIVAVAVLGLCNFSYYANRAAYFNLDIIVQLAGIATCMVWSRFRSKLFARQGTWGDCGKAILAYVSFVLTMVLAMEAVLFSVPLLNKKIENGHYNISDYQQACEVLQETIPENTFAFGGGISMMYAELGWDTIGHYRDMSDLLVGGTDVVGTIVDDALEQEAFAVFLSTGNEQFVLDQIMATSPDFALLKEVQLNGETLQYYTRTEG